MDLQEKRGDLVCTTKHDIIATSGKMVVDQGTT